MTDLNTSTIKSIVTENYRTAAVFEKYSLDFCCKGGKTIGEACSEKGVDSTLVMKELAAIASDAGEPAARFHQWEPAFLIDYIVNNHHAYVRAATTPLLTHTAKIEQVHGPNHPELTMVSAIFKEVAGEMAQHMMKEELILFPAIKALVNGGSDGLQRRRGSVRGPIRMMEMEHDHAGTGMARIRELTGGYVPPEDACTTYRVTLQELKEFEEDLHKHVHLENNILFPHALAIEQELEGRFASPALNDRA